MKVSKTAVLALGGVFMAAGLGLMFVSADDARKDLKIDMDNAVQHFYQVRFISGATSTVDLTRVGGDDPLFRIGANNFVITQTGSADRNVIAVGSNNNSILGGSGNSIRGSYDVILGGKRNTITGGYVYDVILGGEGNNINAGSNSSILGGSGNKIGNYNAVIVGGSNNEVKSNYSLAVGNNLLITGNSDYSVVLGRNATVSGSKSFLWSDGATPVTLGVNNLFAVNGKSGMVVNTDAAHSFAKLTIGGSLVIKDAGQNITCNSSLRGVLRLKNSGGKTCFCSCDGTSWHSVVGGGYCIGVCDTSRSTADCNYDSDLRVSCDDNTYSIENGCARGKVVQGTGSYLIDEKDYIHWTCMEDNGNTTGCAYHLPSDPCGGGVSQPTVSCDYGAGSLFKCKLSVGDFPEGDDGVIWTGEDATHYYWTCNYAGSSDDCSVSKGICPATTYSSGGCDYKIGLSNNGITQTTGTITPGKVGQITATCTNGNFVYSDWSCGDIPNPCPSINTGYGTCNFTLPAAAHNQTVNGILNTPSRVGHLTAICENGSFRRLSGSCVSVPCSNKLTVDANEGRVTFSGLLLSGGLRTETRVCGATIQLSTSPGKDTGTNITNRAVTLSGNDGKVMSGNVGLSSLQKYMSITKRTRYAFSGWQTMGDCGTWAPSTYTYLGPGNNGKECLMKALWKKTNETTQTGTIILPNALRMGYQFTGWYTAKTGGTRVGGSGSQYSGVYTTLYAQWRLDPSASCENYVTPFNQCGGVPNSGTPVVSQGPTLKWKCGTKTCVTCNTGYNHKVFDGNDICVQCNNCAKNGFPYCFPIIFGSDCDEGTQLNISN